ncbi:MAG: hypothetical protein JSR98_18150 [Proteobacteria bacterium]|nr:hypothetical protein [Pseudomonadota bacterium]
MASNLYDGGIRRRRYQALQAAACYFMATLTLGWFFGPIRDFWIRAGADPLLAILSQAVATLLVLVWTAGWVVEAFDVPGRLAQRVAVGFGAIGLLVACDFLVGYLMFDMTPGELVAHFLTPEGAVVAVSLLLAALLPIVRGRRPER